MNGLSAYKDASVTTQSRERLIVMLYDGAIKFMRRAIQEIEAGNYDAKGEYIKRAQDIVSELNTVLDMDTGGEIAVNLRSLYMFINRCLSEADVRCDSQKVQEAITVMEELNKGWRAIVS